MKQVKPLPAPLDGQRKKRGGRRWGPGDRRGGAGRGGDHPGGKGRGSPFPADPLPRPRYRKMKERLGLTEIRKQANRMSFGEVTPPYLAPPPPPPLLWPWQHLCLFPGPLASTLSQPQRDLHDSTGPQPHLPPIAVLSRPSQTPLLPGPCYPSITPLVLPELAHVSSVKTVSVLHTAQTHTHSLSTQAVVTGPVLLTGAPARLTALGAQVVADGMEPWAD